VEYKVFRHFYSCTSYESGTPKRCATYQIFKNRYQVKEFYETGELNELYYVKEGKLHGEALEYYKNGNLYYLRNFSNGLVHGNLFIYNENGTLKAKSKYINNERYYKKVYHYDSRGNFKDSVETILPIIREFKLNKSRDTFEIKAQVQIEGTKFRYDKLDLIFEVYDTIQPDGVFPYTPTDSIIFNNDQIKTLYVPVNPITKNPIKYYLLAIIREEQNGVKRLREPVILELNK